MCAILPSDSGSQIYLNSPELELGVAWQIHMEFLGFSPKAVVLKPVRGLCEMIPGLKSGATELAKTVEFHRWSVAWDFAVWFWSEELPQ